MSDQPISAADDLTASKYDLTIPNRVNSLTLGYRLSTCVVDMAVDIEKKNLPKAERIQHLKYFITVYHMTEYQKYRFDNLLSFFCNENSLKDYISFVVRQNAPNSTQEQIPAVNTAVWNGIVHVFANKLHIELLPHGHGHGHS